MKALLLSLLLTISLLSYSQEYISGKVVDHESNVELAFVTILFNNGHTGVSTDIDGKFKFKNSDNIQTLTLSYIGYEKKTISIATLESNTTITLKKSAYQLEEVVIKAGINPAHRIIDSAIANKNINNPEKATEFFYESYNKVVFDGDGDSSSLFTKDTLSSYDSIKLGTYNHLKSHHYFLMESVSERSFIPPNTSKEVVTASRVSGFKKPFFSLLGTQMQSFSLYKNHLELFGNIFLSPISKNSTSKYLFNIEDTLYQGSDTVFVLSFRPRKGKNFESLKGQIAINTNLYAVQNFIAEPYDTTKMSIKIQQKYQFIENKQWFPVQLNIRILFVPVDKSLIGTVLDGKSYLKNIKLKSPIEKKKFGNVTLKMDSEIKSEGEDFWNSYRIDTLSFKEQNTYQYMDSVGNKIKLDEKIGIYKGVLSGYIPIGPIDLSLNRILRFNGYEGVRAGLGFETNEKLLGSFRIGAYGAYGFKDKTSKYGTHLRWVPKSERQFETKVEYISDVTESGGANFFRNRYDIISSGAIQNLFLLQMDKTEGYQAQVSFRALRDFHFTFFGSQQERTINSSYRYAENQNLNPTRRFNLTETGVNLRFVYKEKFVEFLGENLPVQSKYPFIYFKYARGHSELLEGDYQYNRLDLNISYTFLTKNVGRTTLLVNAGIIDSKLPLTALYRLKGINDGNTISLATRFNFETAFPNEFYSDQYVNFFFRHNFGSLLFKKGKFKPEFLIIHSIAYGELRDKSAHVNVDFRSLEHVYQESGLLINRLVSTEFSIEGFMVGAGLGAYYRYGAYSFPKWEDNFALKLTTSFNF